ncbi:XRE family transcriptional regulator [Nonomuraea turkmeniaca]|uniref:XRE family transcriptional regulator n=1 Tax=Nonomuraea turkmeniaca TaxID=103838 RepID=A0A5S4EXE2_9ACTN|nr:XRE family transcriptional regulator [Nonomuraea turkmeniaca]TMR08175.1 XRE family transcriptional regulator [Nonomuraea turkmeniaca]
MSPQATHKQRNELLRYWIERAAVSYAALADALAETAKAAGRPDLRPDRTRIGHWVNSGEQPRPPLPDLLAATLSRLCRRALTPADLGLSVTPSPCEPTPVLDGNSLTHVAPLPAAPAIEGDHTKRRQALAVLGITAVAPLLGGRAEAAQAATDYARYASATELEPADISDLEVAVDQFGATYSAHPPQRLWPEVFQRRHQAFELLHHRRHTLREGRHIARQAGMLSVILAWLAHDLGEPQVAEAFIDDAKTHGQQADALEVCAWADDMLATHALYDDRPLDALAAATRGLATAPRNSPIAVRLTAQRARAHALLGDGASFADAAAQAHHYQDGLPVTNTGLFAVDAVRIISYDASSHVWLDHPQQARTAALEAIQHYEAAQAPTRLSIAQLDLALAYTALGEVEAAIEAGRQALSCNRLVSAITSRARQLDHRLRRSFPTLSETRDFHDQVRLLQPSV